MKVLLLGVGMQGKAALHDLAASALVSEIIAADRDIEALKSLVKQRGYTNVTPVPLDASSPSAIDALMERRPAVVVDLLPVDFIPAVARAALKHGAHLVNTFYVVPELAALAGEAAARNLTFLPEFGMDPGIDLVLLGEAFRRLDTIEEVRSYGAGIPEPSAAGNPLKYKITWTFDGVLRSYKRPARIMRAGTVVDIPAAGEFAPENIHAIEVDGLGTLEAFPNGDALKYAQFIEDRSALTDIGRYACRWQGHAAFWKKLVDLGFLDDSPVSVDGVAIVPRRFVASLLTPQLQYRDNERDVVFIRLDVRGVKDGRPARVVFDVLDKKDLETGFTAMSRTVGFTASIGAQMILSGAIGKRGILSPVRDVPYEPFVAELAARGIAVSLNLGA